MKKEVKSMRPAKMVWLVIFFTFITQEAISYDYASAQNKAYAEFGQYLYFPLGNYKETNCGFYGYRAPSGNWHGANDYTGYHGEPIYAAHNGVVIAATNGYGNTYQEKLYIGGNYVKIKNGNLTTGYSHLSRSLVREGQVVRTGDIIGEMGNTGYSTGTHLHFSVRHNGVPVDPNHERKPLWANTPPIPANRAKVAQVTQQAIRDSVKELNNIFPIQQPNIDFSTDKKLEVTGCNIENNAQNISPCTQIYISFNQPVRLRTFMESINLEPKTVIMDGIVDNSDSFDQTVFKIRRIMLNPNQNYTLSLKNLVAANGASRIQNWQVSFRTGSWPVEPFTRPSREILIQKEIVHLGNDDYGGTVNQGFEKEASGLTWGAKFQLETMPSLIILEYNSRGVQAAEGIINGNQFMLPNNTVDNNGKTMEVMLPRDYFRKGSNTIQINSLNQIRNDYDDLEFWDMKILY